MKKALLCLLMVTVASPALAQFVIAPSLHYSSNDATDQNSSFDVLGIDAKVGYVLPMGLYLGGMYSTTSFGENVTSTAMGPTVGYFSMTGFYTLLTYHILAERENTAGASPSTDEDGTGPQIDIGWVFPLSSYFSIGPQITYRNIEYSKRDGADNDYGETIIEPYISLWFMF